MDLESFFKQYVETALWSTNDNSTESGGEPLDKNYDELDIAPETLEGMRKDCEQFISDAAVRAAIETREDGYSHAGHDFWLTRNRHGAGFWDGDWHFKLPEVFEGEAGDFLTKRAKEFGTYDLYVTDHGVVYGS